MLLLAGGCRPGPAVGPGAPSPAPPEVVAPTPPIPLLEDQAAALGVRFAYDHGGSGRYYYTEMPGGGAALLDYDGDGWLDLFLPQGAPLPGHAGTAPLRDRLFRNRGPGGGFEDVTARAGLEGLRAGKKGYHVGCAVGDFDNDGDPDLFVTGYRTCTLYENLGTGRFRDVTRAAGIADTQFGSSAAFFDADADGRLDLLVCEYVTYALGKSVECSNPRKEKDYCRPDFYPSLRSRLYRNLGNGRFQDVTEQAGLTRGSSKALGVVCGDVDDDGDTDLFLACDMTPNLLYINDGRGHFTEEAISRNCALSDTGGTLSGMGTDLRDADGDGLPDLLVTNFYMESNSLYRNLGGGMFSNVSTTVGLGGPNSRQVCFGTALRDFNNDGWLDVFITNGHVLAHPEDSTPGAERRQTDQFFVNLGKGQFREVSGEVGPWFQLPHVGRGAAFGDLNNDGSVDVISTSNLGPVGILINRGPRAGKAGNWLQLRLVGRRSNRDGIGARIEVTAGGRTQRDEVRSAYSYLCANDPRAHFGLGAATEAEKVVIRWPSGLVETATHLAAGRIHTLTEGKVGAESR
jgi:hypothetical protein